VASAEIDSKLGKRIKISDSYWDYIVRVKHREMSTLKDEVIWTLKHPFEVLRSRKDPEIHLYYGHHRDKFLCVVVRHLNGEGFIITAYLTRKFGEGDVVWKG